jgi:hypothetical protein
MLVFQNRKNNTLNFDGQARLVPKECLKTALKNLTEFRQNH